MTKSGTWFNGRRCLKKPRQKNLQLKAPSILSYPLMERLLTINWFAYMYIYITPHQLWEPSSSASHSIHRYPTFSIFRNTSSSEKINISIYTTTYRSDTSWLKHGNIREGTYSRRDIDMGSCCRLLRVAGHLHFHRGVHSLCREGK